MKSLSTIRQFLFTASATAKPHHHVMLRGGRSRKTGRGVVIYAPWLGLAAAAAMGVGMALGAGDASAHGFHRDAAAITLEMLENRMEPGTTTHQPHACAGWIADADAGVFCSGTASTPPNYEIPRSGTLMITDTSGFSADVAAGNAFHFTRGSRSGGTDLTLTGSVAATAGHGVYVSRNTGGFAEDDLSVATADVAAGMDGIYVGTDSSVSDIEITATADISVGGTGIHAGQASSYGGDITLTLCGSATETNAGSGLTVHSSAVPEIDRSSMLHGDLVSSDTLALGPAASDGVIGDMLMITGAYTTGGSVTNGVNIDSGEADRLVVMGGVSGTGASVVNLHATGDITVQTVRTALAGTVLIDVTGASAAGWSLGGGSTRTPTIMNDDASSMIEVRLGSTQPEATAGETINVELVQDTHAPPGGVTVHVGVADEQKDAVSFPDGDEGGFNLMIPEGAVDAIFRVTIADAGDPGPAQQVEFRPASVSAAGMLTVTNREPAQDNPVSFAESASRPQ